MKQIAKRYNRKAVEFVVENKGLTALPDGRKMWVTLFVIDGKDYFSSVPEHLSNGEDDVRLDRDSGFLAALNIDPETVKDPA